MDIFINRWLDYSKDNPSQFMAHHNIKDAKAFNDELKSQKGLIVSPVRHKYVKGKKSIVDLINRL